MFGDISGPAEFQPPPLPLLSTAWFLAFLENGLNMKPFCLVRAIFLVVVSTVLFLCTNVYADAVTNSPRIDCRLDYDDLDNESKCIARGCIWNEIIPRHHEIPNCFINLTKVGYKLKAEDAKNHAGKELPLGSSGAALQLDLLDSSKPSAPKFTLSNSLSIKFIPVTEHILRFQITDPSKADAYQVPIQKNFPLLAANKPPKNDSLQYTVGIGKADVPFGFTVTRRDTKEVVWDSTFGGALLYSPDTMLQLATRLSTKFVYGMGENTHTSYLHNLNYKTWPLFAFDQPPDDLERNSYGVHPIMMMLDAKHGTANAIFFLNSNAMEYTLTPDPLLSYKTSGGILDFFIFIGKNPEDVVQQYLSLIGRPMMPPFWGLGFQLSRYGYRDTAQVKRVIDRNLRAKIPVDVHYVDIDYMNVFEDFTYDHKNFSQLPALIKQTRKDMDLKWVFIVDVAIQANNKSYQTFTEGYKDDLYVVWDKSIPSASRGNPTDAPNDKDVFYGRVWPRGPSSFPDFFKNGTIAWWEKHLREFHNELDYDGIWIDMNEPSNFDNSVDVCPAKNCYFSKCPQNKWDFPVARLKAVWVQNRTEPEHFRALSYRTLCLATRQGETRQFTHYDVHSLYALTEAVATQRALANIRPNRRSLILSRSSYASSGRYTAHWTGDNTSKWSHLRRSVVQLLEFSLFGIPWVGADICGFQENVTPELCLRWSQLGAFYPFSRNHNDIPSKVDQDPGVWVEYGHPEVTAAAKSSLDFRYAHLHYLYTLFFHAATKGQTVIRPLFHEFTKDPRTLAIDEQFMVGRSMLVAPFLHEKQKTLTAYLPNDTWWFNIDGETEGNSGYVTVEDSRTVAPVYYRAGSIIPVAITNANNGSTPVLNTKVLRQQPLRLDVYPSEDQASAFGDLYWDDGDSLDSITAKKYNYYTFELTRHTSLNITAEYSGLPTTTGEKVIVEEIRVHGPFKKIVGPGVTYELSWKEGAKEMKRDAKQATNYITFTGLSLNLTSLATGSVLHMNYRMVAGHGGL